MSNADLEKQVATLAAQVEGLLAEVGRLSGELARSQARVTELESRLNTNSTNSSRPPSSDPPWLPIEKRRNGKRKKGAQPGHKGTSRRLVAQDAVTRVVKCELPKSCGECGGEVVQRPGFHRRQVFEVPVPVAEVTEYQLPRGVCAGCRRVHKAQLPPGTPSGVLGPRALAVVATLTGGYLLSRREARSALQQLFNIDVSLGTVSAAENVVSTSLRAPVDEVVNALRSAPVVHLDETGHKRSGTNSWLWTMGTKSLATFFARDRRNTRAAMDTLGRNFEGVAVSDRLGSYSFVEDRRRQFCWAHLSRDFQHMVDDGDHGGYGTRLLGLTRQLFVSWHRYRAGKISRQELREEAKPIRQGFHDCFVQRRRGFAKGLLLHWPALWTFLRLEGVEPTNNEAERDLRRYVLWRKGSFQTDSERGDRFVERMLTVGASCRKQGRDFLAYLHAAVEALLLRRPAPSLLPQAL